MDKNKKKEIKKLKCLTQGSSPGDNRHVSTANSFCYFPKQHIHTISNYTKFLTTRQISNFVQVYKIDRNTTKTYCVPNHQMSTYLRSD